MNDKLDPRDVVIANVRDEIPADILASADGYLFRAVATMRDEMLRLQRRLRWTTERPTEPGWYWWRHGAATGCVLVREEGDALIAYFVGHQLGRPVHRQDGEWAGPLEAP